MENTQNYAADPLFLTGPFGPYYLSPLSLAVDNGSVLATVVYPENDLLAPINIPFDYVFATSMAGQPLAWFEGSNLPRELSYVSKTISEYKKVWNDFHKGYILPVGEMPDGKSWTGFQSITNEKSGYFLVFRENSNNEIKQLKTYLKPDTKLKMICITGMGEDYILSADQNGYLSFHLPKVFSFALYKYNLASD